MREAVTGERNPAYRHGHTAGGKFSATYQSWATMLVRCTNPKCEAWPRYGGRGIEVCARWRTFENFLIDMGERPEGRSLERRDNDGPYSPDNCIWGTQSEQMNNTSRTVRVDIGGVTKPLTEWAKQFGVSLNTVRARVRKQGMSYAEALTKPTRRPDEKLASGFQPGDKNNPLSGRKPHG